MVRIVVLVAFGFLASCASGGGAGSSGAGSARISEGMQRLGASETRGACYAERLSSTLDDEDEDEAARVVEKAQNKDEMREGVLGASGPVRKAFIGASMRCARA
jgi:hypothetical protein